MESSKTKIGGKEKKMKRKELLEKKNAIDELIRTAAANNDFLSSFSAFCTFNRNGLNVYLESGKGDKLTSSTKQYVQNLLKINMEGPFGPEWPQEEKVKRRDMVAPEARYILVCESPNGEADTGSAEFEGGVLVGFVHFRFVLEEEIPVVYVYEIQLESRIQGKGLGKFLMQLVELIARKNGMYAVVLTVQKANTAAMNFYTTKLSYAISSISPSKVDPLLGIQKSYEILCKTFNPEAKAALES